jgi:hypothetical protein
LAGGGALALAAYLYLFISAILSPPMPPVTNANTVVMRALHVVGQRGPKLGWSFSADSSETSVDGSFTTYHNIRDGTYYEHGKPAYHISAKQVTLDTRSQNYSASGAVHIWAVTGVQPRDIKTDGLTWSQALQSMSCPNDVTVLYGNDSYKGRSLWIDFRNGTMHTGQSTVTYRKKSK